LDELDSNKAIDADLLLEGKLKTFDKSEVDEPLIAISRGAYIYLEVMKLLKQFY